MTPDPGALKRCHTRAPARPVDTPGHGLPAPGAPEAVVALWSTTDHGGLSIGCWAGLFGTNLQAAQLCLQAMFASVPHDVIMSTSWMCAASLARGLSDRCPSQIALAGSSGRPRVTDRGPKLNPAPARSVGSSTHRGGAPAPCLRTGTR